MNAKTIQCFIILQRVRMNHQPPHSHMKGLVTKQVWPPNNNGTIRGHPLLLSKHFIKRGNDTLLLLVPQDFLCFVPHLYLSHYARI
jgi:hypothetical protein